MRIALLVAFAPLSVAQAPEAAPPEILLGAGAFLYSFRVARIQGLLLRTGE